MYVGVATQLDTHPSLRLAGLWREALQVPRVLCSIQHTRVVRHPLAQGGFAGLAEVIRSPCPRGAAQVRAGQYTYRRGIETVNLGHAVELLGRRQQPIHLGQIRAADGSWTFMLFLTEDGSRLIACTGVRRARDR